MDFVSFGSVLEVHAVTSGIANVPAFLADLPFSNGAAIGATAILFILGMILVSLLLGGLLTWLASKIVAGDNATFGRAIQTTILHWLASIGIFVLGIVLNPMIAGDQTRATIVGWGVLVLTIAIHILIPAKVYVISGWNAFALNVLTVLFAAVLFAVPALGMIAVMGFSNAKDTFLASYNQALQMQQSGGIPNLSALSFLAPAPKVPADSTAEIDSMITAAQHPVAGHPTLAEREDMVRILQQKLRTQKNNLPPGDAHAALVFQNQLNRYLDLLAKVKAERKLHPFQEGVADRAPMPAGQ